jgi:N-acetylmuramoyl-L-alanine amidase
MRLLRLLLALALLSLPPTAAAAPPIPIIPLEGHDYVELARVAQALRTRLDATAESAEARLRSSGRVITLTRNWSRILIDGTPVVLGAPVRVRQGKWLVPESFLTVILPHVQPVSAGVRATAGVPLSGGVPAMRSAPAPVTLEELRHRSYPGFTRIVLETSGPLGHRVETSAGKEARVRLLGLDAEARAEEINDGFIDAARLEIVGNDAILRVVFEGTGGEVKVSSLADPPRLVLDFMRPGEPAPRGRRDTAGPLRLIVLDAGHGGHDTGAVGPGGLQEKELVLDVTRRVRRLLDDKLDVKILLSRDADVFVPLRDRTSFANKERADLFVSIHANAHPHASHAGVETYFLSSEATDNAARQVAAVENSVVQLEKGPGGRGGRLDAVKAILWDLAQSEFQLESSRLAEVVQDSMTQSLRIPNRGVKQAGFYVLGGAAMPAVLIEIGFVTNPKEEKRLKESRYRDDIARAIVAGLAEYKKKYDGRAALAPPSARASGER